MIRDPKFRSYEVRFADGVEIITRATEALLALPPDERDAHRFAWALIQELQQDGWRPRCAAYDDPKPTPGGDLPARPGVGKAVLDEWRRNNPKEDAS